MSTFHTLFRDSLAIVAFVLAAEVLLWVVSPVYAGSIFDNRFTGGHPIAANELGYRGQLPELDSVAPQTVVLCLGDSVTFGTGVPVAQTWPMQLGRELRQGTASIETINGGAAAADLAQLRRAYTETWRRYRPVVVAVLLTGNMVSFAYARRDQEANLPGIRLTSDGDLGTAARLRVQIKRMAQQFQLPSFVSEQTQKALLHLGLADHSIDPDNPAGALLAYGLRQSGLNPEVVDVAWLLLQQQLKELRDIVAKDGGHLVVGFSPARFSLSDNTYDNQKLVPKHRLTISADQKAKTICEELGVTYVDVKARLQARRIAGTGDLYIRFDYTHFDGEGSGVIASSFAPQITQFLNAR